MSLLPVFVFLARGYCRSLHPLALHTKSPFSSVYALWLCIMMCACMCGCVFSRDCVCVLHVHVGERDQSAHLSE